MAATLNGERAAQKLTFDQLADKTGISARSLKRYLSAEERNMTITHVGEIAKALGLSLTEVVRRTEMRQEGTG